MGTVELVDEDGLVHRFKSYVLKFDVSRVSRTPLHSDEMNVLWLSVNRVRLSICNSESGIGVVYLPCLYPGSILCTNKGAVKHMYSFDLGV